MKTLVKLSLFVILISGYAQAQVATINSNKIWASIPEKAKIDTLAKRELKRLDTEFKQKQQLAIAQQQIAEQQNKINSKSDAAKQSTDKLNALIKEMNDFQKKAQQDYKDYETILYKPYYEKISNAIKIVAERKKYMQVIDHVQVPFVYTAKEADITDEVIKELSK